MAWAKKPIHTGGDLPNQPNHTAKKSLGNQPPLQILEDFTIDISILLYFLFWDIMCVSCIEDNEYHQQIGSRKSSLVRGRMVSFAWNVGHGLTCKVLTDDTQRIICCSRLPLASDAKNKVEEARRMQHRKERFFLGSKHDFDDPTTTLPTLEAFDYPSLMMMTTRVIPYLLLPQALHEIGE